MRLFYSVIFAITILSMTSCYPKRAFYTVELQTVESPTNAKQQFGQTKVVNFSNVGGNKNVFEDEFINILWDVKASKFNFVLTNRSNHPIKIDWDNISYVDYQGYAGEVNQQTTSVVPQGAKGADILLPKKNIRLVEWKYGHYWKENTLIPSTYKTKRERAEKAPTYTGKTMSVLLPIMIEGVQNDYYFTFEIGTWRSRE